MCCYCVSMYSCNIDCVSNNCGKKLSSLQRLMSTMTLTTELFCCVTFNNCLSWVRSCLILLKLFNFLVISMATYINGGYYLPTTLWELLFLLSLMCMDCLYQLLFINDNGEPIFKVTCVCQQEWVSDPLRLISFNFSQSFHLVFLLLHCPLVGTSILASQEDSVTHSSFPNDFESCAMALQLDEEAMYL